MASAAAAPPAPETKNEDQKQDPGVLGHYWSVTNGVVSKMMPYLFKPSPRESVKYPSDSKYIGVRLKTEIGEECLKLVEKAAAGADPTVVNLFIQKSLGSGAYGHTYLACTSTNNPADCKFALKIQRNDPNNMHEVAFKNRQGALPKLMGTFFSRQTYSHIRTEIDACIAASTVGLGPRVYGYWRCRDPMRQGNYLWVILMDLIKGQTLGNAEREGDLARLGDDRILHLVIDLVNRMRPFFAAGWVHRDAHKGNIMISSDNQRLWLIDYGQADREPDKTHKSKPPRNSELVRLGILNADDMLTQRQLADIQYMCEQLDLVSPSDDEPEDEEEEQQAENEEPEEDEPPARAPAQAPVLPLPPVPPVPAALRIGEEDEVDPGELAEYYGGEDFVPPERKHPALRLPLPPAPAPFGSDGPAPAEEKKKAQKKRNRSRGEEEGSRGGRAPKRQRLAKVSPGEGDEGEEDEGDNPNVLPLDEEGNAAAGVPDDWDDGAGEEGWEGD